MLTCRGWFGGGTTLQVMPAVAQSCQVKPPSHFREVPLCRSHLPWHTGAARDLIAQDGDMRINDRSLPDDVFSSVTK